MVNLRDGLVAVDGYGFLWTNPVPMQLSGQFLTWAVVFFVIAIIAAVLGASGVAGITMTVAKWFVIIFLILAVISLLL